MIDGVHVPVVLPVDKQLTYRRKKGEPTINYMCVCDFDLKFTFVCVGCEGSAHDTRIFLSCLNNENDNFPEPPLGMYCCILITILKYVLCSENVNVINIFICRKLLSCSFRVPYKERVPCTI